MNKKLVFIHGRAQENKDAAALKQEWIAAWMEGLKKSGLSMPMVETDIRFPYYGQTLYDLAVGKSASEAASVILKGNDSDDDQRRFLYQVLTEMQHAEGIADDEVAAMQASAVMERGGPLNWEWLQAIVKCLDRHVPYASGMSIALATNDVYQYLDNVGIRDEIEGGVREAMTPDVQTVVVSHSLGTVVAYNLLRREGQAQRWQVPLFVTLGSPLAIAAIKKKLAPVKYPACIGQWFNAMDDRDVVPLYPLDAKNFPINPAITNKCDVNNETENRHGISGYLSDAEVAKKIYDAIAQ
jgi:pimeloyl-ACP methyl ester carboxylesterase